MTGNHRGEDLFDVVMNADQVAAEKRERKEKRVFIVAVAAVVVLALIGASASVIAFTAMTNQREAREAASRRIDILNDQIDQLGADLTAEARSNGARIGELTGQIEALQEQVRQLGGEPVVVEAAQRSSATSTTTTPTTAAPTTTTTTAPPAPEEPAPDACRGVDLLGLCLGGQQ